MSSTGSDAKPAALVDETGSTTPCAVDFSEASFEDGAVYSIKTCKTFDQPLPDRAEETFTHLHLSFDPVSVRRELAKAIIMHDYLLSIITDRGFKGLFFRVFPLVSQSMLRSDILQIYESEKSRSMGLFKGTESRIAITTHKWVFPDQTKSFVAITGHMISDDWEVLHRMMRFVNVPCLSTPELLIKITAECLFDWDVTKKLSTVAINGSCSSSDHTHSDILTNRLSSPSLVLGGKLLRTKCFAHVVSSMVQDALAVVSNAIEKIRASILFWTATSQKEREFREACRDMGISPRDINKLRLDSVSKWNTTFLMLETVLSYKTVFCHLRNSEPQFSCAPSEAEWELLKEVYPKLRSFYHAIKQAAKCKTANSALPVICDIKIYLSRWIRPDNVQVIREMASKMLEKFDKYWVSTRDVFAVASVLDPEQNLLFLKFYFQQIYGDGAQAEIDHIQQLCYDLVNEYQAKSSVEHSNHDRKRKREEEEDPEKHEFDAYLENQNSRSCGILSWWKKAREYPTLRRIARDILAIPICSVPPENTFDIGDSVLSPHRAMFQPKMVGTLMCAQSCLWTRIKGCYSITNSYMCGTSYDYAAVADHTAEGENWDRT